MYARGDHDVVGDELRSFTAMGYDEWLNSWLKFDMPSTLPEDGAPSASLHHLKAWGAPSHPGAPPQPLGSPPRPQ